MQEQNYYQMLELNSKASAAEIKSAYRRLAKQYHPDKTKGDPRLQERFIRISKAYEVLSDEDTRKEYDRTMHQKDTFTHTETKGFSADTIYQSTSSFEQFFGFTADGKKVDKGAQGKKKQVFDADAVFENFFRK